MTQEEIEYANSITMDALAVYENQLKILRVRELRLLIRIREAIRKESLAGQEDEQGKKGSFFVNIGGTQTISTNPDGGQSKTLSTQSESHAMYILRLETALTQVQDQIRRVVDNLAKLGSDRDGDETDVPSIEVRVVDGRRNSGD